MPSLERQIPVERHPVRVDIVTRALIRGIYLVRQGRACVGDREGRDRAAQADEAALGHAVTGNHTTGKIASVIDSQCQRARSVGDVEPGKDVPRQEEAVDGAIRDVGVVATDLAGVIDPAGLVSPPVSLGSTNPWLNWPLRSR